MSQAAAAIRKPLKILVPTDFSECANAALDYARKVANEHAAEIELLHVGSARAHPWSDGRTVQFAAPAEHGAQPAPVKIHHRLELGDATSTIMRVAASEGVDLIVMGNRGTTESRHKVEGHVAREVARYAICPVVRVQLPVGRDV
jgi:nucleotide-binding universal stress UspA family protein